MCVEIVNITGLARAGPGGLESWREMAGENGHTGRKHADDYN